MGNHADLLEPDVHAAAAAIANARAARRGAPLVTNILDVLPASLFAEVVEDARVALAAGRIEAPPEPRARGPLNGLDAAALGNDLRAGSLLILAWDRKSVAQGATWAPGALTVEFGHAAAKHLWDACAAALGSLPESPELYFEVSPEEEQRP